MTSYSRSSVEHDSVHPVKLCSDLMPSQTLVEHRSTRQRMQSVDR